METAYWAILGPLLVALGGFIGKTWFIPREKREDLAASIRDELRAEIRQNRIDISILEKEVNTWRFRYYKLVEIAVQRGWEIPHYLLDDFEKITISDVDKKIS